MSRAKEMQSKKMRTVKTGGSNHAIPIIPAPEEEMGSLTNAKLKKPIEIDIIESVIETEEKADDESAVLGAEDEESEDTLTLDEEELNPFGDKWEQ